MATVPRVLKRLVPPPALALRRWWRERNSFAARLQRVGEKVARHCGRIVMAGPFRGMRYGGESFCSGYAPKLLGCYEAELLPTFARILAKDYPFVVDIGAAEGYYAVGLARSTEHIRVHAFEIDDHARGLCEENARLNGVSGRIVLHGGCDLAALRALPWAGRGLVICDCEGYEITLMDPEAVPALKTCDLLVEMHDCFDPRITPTLVERFQGTHDIHLMATAPHDPADFPAAHFLPPEEQVLAVDDGRAASMQWAFMEARESGGTA